MTAPSLTIQAACARLMAVNLRGSVENHERLATKRGWNPDLIPGEWRHVQEAEAVAATMTWLERDPRAQALRNALPTDNPSERLP